LKILLLSDTHSYIDDAILQHAQWADEVWHAGDFGSITVAEKLQNIKPLRGVYGNIDGTEIRSLFPEKQLFECEGMQVLMTHIGGYPSHYQKGIPELLEREKPQLFICGHSHILKGIYDKKYQLLHLNPGAIGKYGAQKTRTMLRFEILQGNISQMEIIEYPL
jgi:hypothetical protein